MSERDLIREYKNTIADLTKEKDDAIQLVSQKDTKIKQLLIQVEQANADVHTMGKKIKDLDEKARKNATFKRIIHAKIDQVLEKKDEDSVDTEE